MCVKANELEGGLAGSIDDSLDIGIGNANYSVTAAIAATGTPKFQILLPVLQCHCSLRLAINYANQKSAYRAI
jgi:CSLREA domain-containing protein